MQPTEYHKKIIQYYKETENAYKDSWDLKNSLSIHYGYWDIFVKSFSQSLIRMNEMMLMMGRVKAKDRVLDAGCGVGGSSIFLASILDCRVTGITLSERQAEQATENARKKGLADKVDFKIMNYAHTSFPDQSFDVVWGCESVCYADNKEDFVKEAFRLLKPGGRLIIADGFVAKFENNDDPVIRQWLDGWQVNYLETPDRFQQFLREQGFSRIVHRDISPEVAHSSRRLLYFYFLANLYLFWKKISFSRPATAMQKQNIRACKYQYIGMKKGLWQYAFISGRKP
ncbi:MAG TPA: methyltransferase domain-containing protein [Chitinophagaceae bacterium]|nr:methyltransferase domain-containing protein [Chitinophagaceae bacterium]